MNVVVVLADQLRADCVGCYGNSIVKTPHIDRLANAGTRFSWAFSQHPQCAPSRASLLTGRYPHTNGSISNFTATGDHERTLGERYRAAGYQSVGVGKLHLFKEKQEAGFSDLMVSGGQHSGSTDAECLDEDYKNWMRERGHWDALKEAYAQRADPNYRLNFQCKVSPLPPDLYIDGWVGNRAVEFIEAQSATRPFFMFVGLPNPHNPFEPPEPYASIYDPSGMPIPESFQSDLSKKPPQHLAYKKFGRAGMGSNYELLTEEALRQVIAYYYASITLVDDQVGKIIDALEAKGIMDDTVVVFLSDHGELLGDHGMLLKSTDAYPILYDNCLHVPLIFRVPGAPAGQVVESAVELVDLAPTILEATGLEMAPEFQGFSLLDALHGGDAPTREWVFCETGAVKMLRGGGYKLVYYPGQTYGELYDLNSDPHEMNNLWMESEYADVRSRMIIALLDRLIGAEGALHGESMRGPAYWKLMHHLPFKNQARESVSGPNTR